MNCDNKLVSEMYKCRFRIVILFVDDMVNLVQ